MYQDYLTDSSSSNIPCFFKIALLGLSSRFQRGSEVQTSATLLWLILLSSLQQLHEYVMKRRMQSATERLPTASPCSIRAAIQHTSTSRLSIPSTVAPHLIEDDLFVLRTAHAAWTSSAVEVGMLKRATLSKFLTKPPSCDHTRPLCIKCEPMESIF